MGNLDKDVRPVIDEVKLKTTLETILKTSLKLQELPSFGDRNFLVLADDGSKFVFKIYNENVDLKLIQWQAQILDHLASVNSEVIYQKVILFEHSLWPFRIEFLRVKLMNYIEGEVAAKYLPQDQSFNNKFGKFIGSVLNDMADFAYDSVNDNSVWDLKNFLETTKNFTEIIENDSNKQIIGHFRNLFQKHVYPFQSQFRSAVIHGDLNTYNVIINKMHEGMDFKFGVIDFGDMVYSNQINEIAIAISYFIQEKQDPISILIDVTKSCNQIYPIEDQELDVLFILVATRICISVYLTTIQMKTEPENEYIVISQKSGWETLQKLYEIDYKYAKLALKDALTDIAT